MHVPIQQGLADLDPDVDAIWRLARPSDIGNIKFGKGPGLAYSRHAFSPYNTQNTVHYQPAFWALFIPSGVNMSEKQEQRLVLMSLCVSLENLALETCMCQPLGNMS